MPPCTFNVAAEDIAEFIERYGNETDTQLYQRLWTNCIDFVSSEYIIAYHPLTEVAPISVARDEYSRIPKLYGLLDATAVAAAGVTPILDYPHLNARGQGVIIGFIDTGIDYQNPLFRFSDGTSRILGLWDQTIPRRSQADNPYFLYGTTYSQSQINQALASANPLSVIPSQDTNGHGTFMAGVAAGNAMPESSFTGCAPEAMIAVVKLKPAKRYLRDYYLIEEDVLAYQENDIMTGIRYLVQVANDRHAQIVIYLGVGTNQGNHTGASPLGTQLQGLSLPFGVTFVTGAGNETGLHHHYRGNLRPEQTYEDVELRVAAGNQGFCLELWSIAPELYTVGFVSPGGEVVERLPNINGNESTIPFLLDNSSVTVTFIHVESGSGDSLVFMRFANPSPGIWHIRVYPSVFFSGNYNMWLPMDGFVPADTFFLRPDPDTIVTDPGNSIFALTIGAYDHVSHQIYIHSSRGFNRNGAVTPGIVAPGVNVYGPMPTTGIGTGAENPSRPFLAAASGARMAGAAQTPGSTQTPGNTQMPGSTQMPGNEPTASAIPSHLPEIRYTRKSGTSVAAAIFAGAVADLLSYNVARGNSLNLSSASVRSFFVRGATRNPALSYPSREWGYGILNLYESFQKQ